MAKYIYFFQQSKTPNGNIRKGQRYDVAPFDFARYDEADITLETVLDDTTNTNLNLFDTSRRPELDHRPRDISPNSSFNKLPDDNMNSEITRSTFELDNSKILPTLQPNGWDASRGGLQKYKGVGGPYDRSPITRQFKSCIVKGKFDILYRLGARDDENIRYLPTSW